MSNLNIKGVDISNNNNIKDLSTLKNNNVKYVILKATEGTTFQDSTSKYRYKQAKELGMKVGFYHFLVSTSSPITQAENFYNYIKDMNSDIIPFLDIEKDWNSMSNACIEFLEHFKKISNDRKIGIYTYSGFLCNFTQKAKDYMKDMPCWIANYTKDYKNVDTGFFNNIVGWQYSENGTIGDFRGDCNLFNEDCLLEKEKKGEWIQKGNNWWYKHYDGSYTVNNWEKINGEWYFFNEEGWMMTGWLKSPYSGKFYLLWSNGKMAHDCEAYGYRFNSNGEATKL